jgi:hypothetical protein
MSRPATVWWNKQRGAWCTDIGGTRHLLAKGTANKKLAKDKLKELLDEQARRGTRPASFALALVLDALLWTRRREPRKA